MKKICSLIGLVFFCGAPAALAADSLYESVRTISRSQFLLDGIDPSVSGFIAKVWKYDEESPVTASTVDAAVIDDYAATCEGREMEYGQCVALAKRLSEPAIREQELRVLGRDLQLIATSYEYSLVDDPRTPLDIGLKLASIIALWQSGPDRYLSPTVETVLRSTPVPPDLENLMADAEGALTALASEVEDEKLTAVIWRYQYGFKQIEKEGGACDEDDETGDGTELQYTRTRWCDVEDALNALLEALPQNPEPGNAPDPDANEYDPPLAGGEKAIFQNFDLDGLGIVLWLRSDDAGFRWKLALEPVLPSLDCTDRSGDPEECVENAILGGTYPDESEDPKPGTGICHQPLGKKGYLCRELAPIWCPEEEENGASDVTLTRCASPDFQPYEDTPDGLEEPPPMAKRLMYSGPNICGVGGWQIGPEREPGEEFPEVEDSCKNCKVEVTCGECGVSGNQAGGGAETKTADGAIKLCIGTDMDVPATYILMHELVHAQDHCRNAPITEQEYRYDQDCCAAEYPAYAVNCNAMAEDGVFDGSDITVEKCIAGGVHGSCKLKNVTCPAEESIEELEAIGQAVENLSAANPGNVPAECSENPEEWDPRVQALYYSMPGSCDPECITRYGNTIGNNLCYAGQCIEQSLEEQRLIPGRAPLMNTDEAFPWDSCSARDPELGRVLALPVQRPRTFPPYNPLALIEQMDREICQMNGLPALTPPVLCSFSPTRRLSRPLAGYAATVINVTNQEAEFGDPAAGLERLAPSVAVRIGTRLHAEYLAESSREFRDLLTATTQLLESMGTIAFPDAMCPRLADGNVCAESPSAATP